MYSVKILLVSERFLVLFEKENHVFIILSVRLHETRPRPLDPFPLNLVLQTYTKCYHVIFIYAESFNRSL
jgi:hypothetical protein